MYQQASKQARAREESRFFVSPCAACTWCNPREDPLRDASLELSGQHGPRRATPRAAAAAQTPKTERRSRLVQGRTARAVQNRQQQHHQQQLACGRRLSLMPVRSRRGCSSREPAGHWGGLAWHVEQQALERALV